MTLIPNPYNPLQPPQAAEHFFGREAVFTFFRQNLVGTPHQHALVLIGRRGIGKSSVLHRLPDQFDERYRLCVVNLARRDITSEAVFIAELVDEIRLVLETTGASTYRLPDWPERVPGGEPVDLRAWFHTEYLEVALSALRQRHLLLALDDAHLLLQAITSGTLPHDVLGFLGDILADHPRLDMIFALDAAFETDVFTIDVMSDPALHFRLTELASEDAERLILEPVRDVYTYEDGVPAHIQALAGGHPFLLHSICRLLFRRSEERGHNAPITEYDLSVIHDAVMDQADEILRPLWQDAAQNQRLTLQALVDLSRENEGNAVAYEAIHNRVTGLGYSMNQTQLAAALRSLDYDGLAAMDADGSYRVPAGLIADWVKANSAVQAEKTRSARDIGRLVPVVGLLAVLVIVGGLGAAALLGVFDPDNDDEPAGFTGPTATLSLNLEATRQSDYATQTQRARPTRTPTVTASPSDTASPSVTATATITKTPTITVSPTVTISPTITNTPSITASRTVTASPTVTASVTASPTKTASSTATTSRTVTASLAVTVTRTARPSSTPTNVPRTATRTATLAPEQ
ncbi:MAG: AAA family ATPase [Anaerolineae bacterium]|nr:AAA family ATPase [Anaerolineae bacterium]